MKILANAKIITPHRVLDPGYVVIDGGTIAEVGSGLLGPESAAEHEIIDLAGYLLAPGLIDIHIHGGGGVDCMEGDTVESLETIGRLHASGGTTSYLPTTLTAPLHEVHAFLEGYHAYRAQQTGKATGPNFTGADPIGVHIEGPYFAPEQAGAQPAEYMIDPVPADYEPLLDACPSICRMTAAPELPGGMALGRALRRRGHVACIGHAQPTAAQVREALDNGYTHRTHVYSGMQGVTRQNAYRVAGLVEAGYLYDALTVELIADGSHLPPELLQLVYKVKGPDRIALVTDAISAAGCGGGDYLLAGQESVVEDGVAKLADRSAFAGSVALMNELVRNMVELAGVPLGAAVQMATATPARIMGIDGRKGVLAAGMDADLVVLDASLAVRMTLVGGQPVYDMLTQS